MDVMQSFATADIRIADPVIDAAGRRICQVYISHYLCQSILPLPQHAPLRSTVPAFVTSTLYQDQTNWVFSSWECAPGPCLDDFISTYSELAPAVEAVVQYHIGGPTLLGPWVVPLHRHPELRLEHVRRALTDAITVSSDTFAAIADRRTKQIFGNYRFGADRWTWALQCQFLPIAHITAAHHTLYLRRDAQESYVVQTLVTSTNTS